MNSTLKKKFFMYSVFLSLFIIMSFGVLLGIFMFENELRNVRTIIKQKNKAVANFIDGYFKKFYTILNFLSDLDMVRFAYRADEKSREKVRELYRNLKRYDSDINYVYSGYRNNFLLIADYTPPEGFQVEKRPWYIAAIKSAPEVSKGIPYREIKTKEWLISLSKALYDEDGNIVGVVAIDTSMDKINNLINKKGKNFKSLYSYILSGGKIIFHPDERYLFKTVRDLLGEDASLDEKEGSFTYIYIHKKIAYYTKISPLGWTVVTVVNLREVIWRVLSKILIFLSVITAGAIFLGWWLSRMVSPQVIAPLLHLKDRVESVSRGEYREDEFDYPDNEIGEIALEIEKLTEREIYKRNLELTKLNKKLEQMSIRDKLTGLYNRYKMDEELKRSFHMWERYKAVFSLLIIDIDDFKKVNDLHGHTVGDEVLKGVAEVLSENIRKTDVIARWGGEEFLILMPETDKESAVISAEKLRKIVERRVFANGLNVTISIGAACIRDHDSLEEVIKAADKNMYRAKKSGKNRVCCA